MDDRSFTVACAVRRRRITVSLDGTPMLRWDGDPSRLSADPFFRFPKPDALYLGSWESSYRVTTLKLTPALPDLPEHP